MEARSLASLSDPSDWQYQPFEVRLNVILINAQQQSSASILYARTVRVRAQYSTGRYLVLIFRSFRSLIFPIPLTQS